MLKLCIFLLAQHPHKPNRLWAPHPGDWVPHSGKAGPCHKFPFLPSPDSDLLSFKRTNEITSCLLLVCSILIKHLPIGQPLPLSPSAWIHPLVLPCPVWPSFMVYDDCFSKTCEYNINFISWCLSCVPSCGYTWLTTSRENTNNFSIRTAMNSLLAT